MSKLISTYASFLGLKIDKPYMQEDFFPIPTDLPYITLQSSSTNQIAKNYDNWVEVINTIRPYIGQTKIVLVGTADDAFVKNVDVDLRGKCSLAQTQYVIKRAILHLGVDSCWTHVAGFNGIPLVALYANTSPSESGPYWADPQKTVLLESHRGGGHPSYAVNENPKTINFITPSSIAKAVLQLLGIPHRINYDTTYVGVNYHDPMIEVIPNMGVSPTYVPGDALIMRMDMLHNEKILSDIMSTGRRVHIIANRECSPTMMKLLEKMKDNVLTYNHEITPVFPSSPVYCQKLQALFQHAMFFVKNVTDEGLAQTRLKYLGYVNITEAEDRTKEQFFLDWGYYSNKEIDRNTKLDKLYFKSTKYVLSNNRIYPSYAHLSLDIPFTTEDGKDNPIIKNGAFPVVDSPEFWKDFQSFLIQEHHDTT